MSDFVLPSKVFRYLRRLALNYQHSGPRSLFEIATHAHVAIEEDVASYHDFGEDHFGHNVTLFLPKDVIGPITIADQAKLIDRLETDLRACAMGTNGNEYFANVRFELMDENDPECQGAQLLTGKPPPNPESLSFWKPGQIRLFISHRDTRKVEAHALAAQMEQFGISCFVAHDDIEPTESWQNEIEKALQTMEIFLALVTPDFHESVWTNQEVGFAKANNVPIVCLKLGAAPRGFIGDKQAIQGILGKAEEAATDIYKILRDKLKQGGRMQGAIITAFCKTPNFAQTQIRFDLMNDLVQKLSEAELEKILEAFARNEAIRNAYYLTNSYDRLKKFLKRVTRKEFVMEDYKLKVQVEEDDDAIPF